MTKRQRYSPEVRERAVRMVFEHVNEYWFQMGSHLLDRGEDRLYISDAP